MNDIIPTIDGFKKIETNGGKGSGNFGHSGRPGKRGGSGKGQSTDSTPKRASEKSPKETDGQQDKGFQSEYKIGDSYTKGGVTYDVVDGENGPHAVSKDGKITTTLPDELRHDQTKMIKDTFDGMRDEGIPMSSPRYQAARDTYKRIQERAIETSRKGLDASRAPEMVRKEVDRFLRKIETPDSSKSVEAYYKTSTGGTRWLGER